MSEEAQAKKPKYHSVNGAWPEGTDDGRDLKPTPQEAVAGAKRLYRFVTKKSFRGKIKVASGNRYTTIRRGVMYVNPDETYKWRSGGGGWHEIVHGLSHRLLHRLHHGAKPHGMQHAFLEKEMIRHVVESGWLDGKLKRPEKPKAEIDVKQIRRDRVLKRISSWEAKRRRADNALKKLRRQARYYGRACPSPDAARLR